MEDKPSEFFMQWVNTLIGLGKQTNLHLPIEGMHWYVDWVQMNPHALLWPGDATGDCMYDDSAALTNGPRFTQVKDNKPLSSL